MKKILSLFVLSSLMLACANPNADSTDKASNNSQVEATENTATKSTLAWANNATIYEVNIRQYTEEGTINAFAEHLDRLQNLGVKVLWMMPVQPIGVKNRKGTEGSYYSISNYTEINPRFGTMDDFKNLVKEAHKRDMKVILDWVANHTSFDHPWTEAHPDWYTRDSLGNIIPPVADWSDVADLNYENRELWIGMRDAMKTWVRDADIDGFRCDVAMMVPMEFWNETRAALDSIKPVFMLAEAEGPAFHEAAFDMTYGWENHHIFNKIASGEMDFYNLKEYLEKEDTVYQPEDLRMNFITNHDENSWNGTVEERMGANGQNFYVLCVGLNRSMPLIYSGQEAGLNKRLAFFESDPISWADTSQYAFYRAMSALKANHPALLNGTNPAEFKIHNTGNDQVFAFSRTKGDDQLSFYLNFGTETADINLKEGGWSGNGKAVNYISGAELDLDQTQAVAANSFLIATKQ